MAAKKVQFHSKVPFLMVEVLGLGLSIFMFLVSTEVLGKEMLPCGRSKWFACEKIIQGPFSHFGPFGVAAMGVVYYLLHLALTAGLRDRTSQLLKLALVGGGLVFIAWLRSLELIYIHKICPWCWGVALLTLIHAGFSYGLAYPLLPRMRALPLAGWIFGGFILLVGLVTLLEHGVKTGQMLLNQGWKSDGPSPAPAPATETPATTKKTATPKPISTPKPKTTPEPTAPQIVPTAPPAPTAAPKPVAMPVEPQLLDTPEVRQLRAMGFRHAASGEDVIKILKQKPPVLMLAYDPLCKDCHNLIMNVLPKPELAALQVTRVAIQESMLSGQVNSMVRQMPTLLLFGSKGDLLFSHVGSAITPADLANQMRAAMAQGAQ